MPASSIRFSASGIFNSPEISFGNKVSLREVNILFSLFKNTFEHNGFTIDSKLSAKSFSEQEFLLLKNQDMPLYSSNFCKP